MSKLKGRDFLTLADFSQDEIYQILSQALEVKRLKRLKHPHQLLKGKTIAMIFQKPSTRTRLSFEAGIAQLGAYPIFLNAADLQLTRGESFEDTGKVISRYVDGIVMRAFAHKDLEELAEGATVPVINGLTDDFHPCQVLADFMTILEKRDRLAGLKLAYVGDGNNVANSLLLGSVKVGLNISIASPRGFEPKEQVVRKAMHFLRGISPKVSITEDPVEGVKKADIVYTDVWTSMGKEDEHKERKAIFGPYQVNKDLLAHAKKDVIVMHCLPAHYGEEITADVLDNFNCVFFDQAENRLHAQKALLTLLLGD
jgi:ornithine carbamoyltransferase